MIERNPQDEHLNYTHLLTLLSVSAAMVGVCLTAIGLVSVIKSLSELEGWVDDMLAIGMVLFSLVTLLSFLGLRTNIRRSWRPYTLILDVVFCIGIMTLVMASLLLTYMVI